MKTVTYGISGLLVLNSPSTMADINTRSDFISNDQTNIVSCWMVRKEDEYGQKSYMKKGRC
jgi:hypothetical protein